MVIDGVRCHPRRVVKCVESGADVNPKYVTLDEFPKLFVLLFLHQ